MIIKTNPKFLNASILIVDDAPFARKLISTALTKAGFARVETAEDGEEGVQKTYNLRPDLVLLDLDMPKLDGFGYCEAVRSDKNLPHMPIIVQTALEERNAMLRALSCGADDFLTKPLDMEELVLRIFVHIERHFMLRDMKDICSYLKLELEQTKILQRFIKNTGAATSENDLFDKHLEVMKELVAVSSAE